jgi:aminoglycoside phosphotransferase (APT) family kinase protein
VLGARLPFPASRAPGYRTRHEEGGVPREEVVDIAMLEPVARRVFPAARSVFVEPASPGRLLVVYRVRADDTVCYLRVAEEAGQDLTTDAWLLDSLAGLGARVPGVVHVESDPRDLDRSFLVVAALDGGSLACHGTDAQARHAARAAGRDSALISAQLVDGFGWVRRDGRPGLRAGPGTYAGFAASDLPARWPGWLAGAFTTPELDCLGAIVAEECQRPAPQAHLAHGDLDVTHIWLDRHGRYTGIIDFGEIRGADPFFDAGHFLLHDREARPAPLFEDFLAGYAEAGPLPEGHRERIRRSAILSGLRQLSLWLGPRRNYSPASRPARSRITRLRGLITAGSR